MIALQIAEWIENLDYQQLPSLAVEAAKNQIIDTFGVCLRGSTYESSKALFSSLDLTRNNISTFIGLGIKGSAMQTALFNGTSAHSVEMDDFHNESILHPGVVVVPASFAMAEEAGLSGKEWILSVIIGYEIMIRVGIASRASQQERGFHPTGTCGSFGSAAAVGKLLDLPADKLARALGIAGSYTGGLLEFHSTGAWTKRLNAGLAARSGILAAKLAQSGFTGPETIFEGKSGFLQAYGNRYELDSLNISDFPCCKIEEISIKPHSSCRFSHSAIDGLVELVSHHHIDPNEISQIVVETNERSYNATMEPLMRKRKPQSQVDGQFSLPYCLALAAHYRYVHPHHFDSEYLNAEDLRKTSDKVIALVTEEFNVLYPQKNACRITVRTGNGEYSTVIQNTKGDPENPLTRGEIKEKFARLTQGIMKEQECRVLLDRLENLESLAHVNELFSF